MASLLRQIVAGPRARHPEAGLDLCYMTDNSSNCYLWSFLCLAEKAYRNPTDQLVAFLDRKHEKDWSIFEFRAEGTGYPDSEVYNRIHHFPWPDHHPPPFAIVPNLMASMRNWIQRLDEDSVSNEKRKRVAVLHCKAGKGRSGTVACSYLISEEGWSCSDALQRFTDRRMRVGFGNGVSIPSQLRWVSYVDRWANKMGKSYVERPVEIKEIHVWGLRDGVRVAVEGYVENGKRIEMFHVFTRQEKTVIEEGRVIKHSTKQELQAALDSDKEVVTNHIEPPPSQPATSNQYFNFNNAFAGTYQTVILRPSSPVILPTSDVNIDFERRNQATSSYTGFTMVTSIAHVWFNAYFEGGYKGDDSGVFEIEWEAMDGIKGSVRKGTKALERLKIVWQFVQGKPDAAGELLEKVITQPKPGEPVPEGEAANWEGENADPAEEAKAKHSDGVDSGRPGGALLTMGVMVQAGAGSISKELGLRRSDPASAELSRAPSVDESQAVDQQLQKSSEIQKEDDEDDFEGVQAHVPEVEDHANGVDEHEKVPAATRHESPHHDRNGKKEDSGVEGRQDTAVGYGMEVGLAKLANVVAKVKSTTAIEKEGLEGGTKSNT